MSSSTQDSTFNDKKEQTDQSKESETHWYPWTDKRHNKEIEELVARAIHEQKIENENKILDMRSEIIVLRYEILSLKETVFKLSDNIKSKSVIDERKKNIIRKALADSMEKSNSSTNI